MPGIAIWMLFTLNLDLSLAISLWFWPAYKETPHSIHVTYQRHIANEGRCYVNSINLDLSLVTSLRFWPAYKERERGYGREHQCGVESGGDGVCVWEWCRDASRNNCSL